MKKKVQIMVNVLLAVLVFTIWILSFFLWRGDAALSVNGWEDLKFFTVQSNLLVGIVAVVWLITFAVTRAVPHWLSVLKYVSAVAVFVTFSVVLLFLGPFYGYKWMYSGSNLYFHLLIPIFAIAEEAIFGEDVSFKESFFAALPPALYGVGYLANCLANGIGEGYATNDWYGFLTWGYGGGAAFFVVICALAWGMGLALRALQKPARKIPWEVRK
ncbi:MAG: hypothetical protein J6Y74_04250 [Clostridia bacterium]|nr:hypothetical protein [Clostridia bacterium]